LPHDQAAGVVPALQLDPRIAQVIYGPHNELLNYLEEATGVHILTHSNEIVVTGERAATNRTYKILENLAERARKGEDITTSIIDAELRFTGPQDGTAVAVQTERAGIKLRKAFIQARTQTQNDYVQALNSQQMVFGMGPAGTGKTFLAVAKAVQLLETNKVDRIIITRPAVEAGEKLGFLPGDMKEKVDPYMRPIYDALNELTNAKTVEDYIAKGILEIAPVAFMRGRTLARAAIIVDEAQNLTPLQMKMVLTRFGEGSQMIITGDPGQVDLPPNMTSGLADAQRRLEGISGIAFVHFGAGDVVRHPLVGHIVAAYENDRNQTGTAPAPRT
jgi:phosphate starvation-inducible PhoH-like protein